MPGRGGPRDCTPTDFDAIPRRHAALVEFAVDAVATAKRRCEADISAKQASRRKQDIAHLIELDAVLALRTLPPSALTSPRVHVGHPLAITRYSVRAISRASAVISVSPGTCAVAARKQPTRTRPRSTSSSACRTLMGESQSSCSPDASATRTAGDSHSGSRSAQSQICVSSSSFMSRARPTRPWR